MAAKSRRKITVTYSNDVEGENELNAADSSDSPAMIEQFALSDGDNEIEVPSGATCASIVKAGGNTIAITLKGDAGDTGILLHNTDPDSISLASGQTSFFLSITSEVDTSVRIFWS